MRDNRYRPHWHICCQCHYSIYMVFLRCTKDTFSINSTYNFLYNSRFFKTNSIRIHIHYDGT